MFLTWWQVAKFVFNALGKPLVQERIKVKSCKNWLKTLALALSRQIAEGFLDYTNDAKQIELVNDKVLQTLAK